MTAVTQIMMGVMGGAITIGLTMASGAHFAPTYDDASLKTQAAVVMTAVKHTGSAVVMARALDGSVETGMPGVQRLVKQGYLSSLPTNPTNDQPSGIPVLQTAADGTQYVQMRLIGDDGRLCDEIAKQTGLAAAPVADVAPLQPLGCIRSSVGSVAFSRS